MQIWVDADACPNIIKTVLIRAAERTGVNITFVANQAISLPPYPSLHSLVVSAGFDVADHEIVRRTQPLDLVITSDIPLAAEVIEKGGAALSPRGESFSKETIRSRLIMRDFLDTMRSSGVQSGGPPPLNETDKREFSNALDRYLTRHFKR